MICGKKDHKEASCLSARPQSGACFNYIRQGHKATNCLQANQNPPTTQTTYPVTSGCAATVGPTKVGNQKPRTQGKVYVFTQKDAQTSNIVVTGTIPISSIFAYTLFDTGASHSFVSPSFASQLGIIIEPWDVKLLIDTPTGDEMVTDSVCKSCIIVIENKVLLANLIVLDMHDFDVILGMDWLVKHYTNLDFRRKRIDFQILGDQEFSFIGSSSRTPPKIISVL